MEVRKVRFVEPGNLPYRRSPKNLYTYERYIRNPSIGLLTLATVVHGVVPDTLMYSESISYVNWDDVYDADIVFIGIFTFNANRGYEIADRIRERSDALVVMGGLHASLNYPEAIAHCDYVLLGEADESIRDFICALMGSGQDEGSSWRGGGSQGTGVRYIDFSNFPGLVYSATNDAGDPHIVHTGNPKPPHNIDLIPDRDLLYRYRKMAGHSTLWPQVHASRGCPHSCDYCAVVRHFGHRVRTRSPENVVEDIRQAINFHDRRLMPRFSKVCWITDDNFFADRAWAISVLKAIIASDINYRFTIQARYEVGLDDEMLDLLKRAGFIELAMGIEFIEDRDFETYHKKCSNEEVIRAIHNTQAHGLNVRGLFIFGAKHHTKGIGRQVAAFVEEHGISGVLLQSMYFVPGTPVYEASKGRLLHEDWSKCTGHVVHWPDNMRPAELEQEVIEASSLIYSKKNLWRKLLRRPWIEKVLALGEHYWHKSIRSDMRKELAYLKELENQTFQQQLAVQQLAVQQLAVQQLAQALQ